MIVVDDLHLAAPAPAMLTAFIDALPDTLPLRGRYPVGSAAVAGPAASARRAASSCAATISASSAAEMSDFFALHDVSLARDELHRLHELTEGWPAGAQLAAIALQRGVGRDDFLDGVRQHGSRRRATSC